MNGHEEEQTAFEIGVVVPKRSANEENEDCDCVGVLVDEFRKAGLIVERVQGIADEFIKVWFSFVFIAPLQLYSSSSRFTLFNSSFLCHVPTHAFTLRQLFEEFSVFGSWVWLIRKKNYLDLLIYTFVSC